MVEKIIVNPQKVRGLGNIVLEKDLEDFQEYLCGISEDVETINGVLEEVFTLSPDSSHSYALAFGSSSYVAVGGSVSVSVTLTDGGVAVGSQVITFTGGSSTVTATTDSSGVATATITVTEDSTITASFSNVTATCTVTYQSYLFYDSGVTGTKNTNYTKHSDVNVSTTSTGTTVSSVADCYPKCYSPNVTLDGDFEIEFTQLTNSNWWQLMVHFADTSNNVVDFAYLSGGGYNRLVTQNDGTRADVGTGKNNGYANYTHTFPVTVKITRVGSTYSYYEDDDLKLTTIGTTNDVTFGFMSDDISRTVYKDLKIIDTS